MIPSRTWRALRIDSDVVIHVDGIPIVTIHYVYPHNDNAAQWSAARLIIAAVAVQGDTVIIEDGL